MKHRFLSDQKLNALEQLCVDASPAPWKCMAEGRDHTSGDSFIQVGQGETRADDVYMSRDTGPASIADLDLIAELRTALPKLVAEVRYWRSLRKDESPNYLGKG
jgi:hypothetical protein